MKPLRFIVFLLVVASLAFIVMRGGQQPATATTARQPGPALIYSAKFLCGFQKPLSPTLEPPVKPGNYATEINILNYHQEVRATLQKGVLVLLGTDVSGKPRSAPEPAVATPVPTSTEQPFVLPAGRATMDDCPLLLKMAGFTPAAMTLTIGYFNIVSNIPIDVDAVYTAETSKPGASGPGIAEQVLHITGNQFSP